MERCCNCVTDFNGILASLMVRDGEGGAVS